MAFHRLTPNLMVPDVDRTVDFYRDVLEFELAATVPQRRPYEWAMLGRDDVVLMIQSRASLGAEIPALRERPIGGSLALYMDVDDADALFQRLRNRVAVVVDPHTTPYGTREFFIQDCNGYILGFAASAKEEERVDRDDDR